MATTTPAAATPRRVWARLVTGLVGVVWNAVMATLARALLGLVVIGVLLLPVAGLGVPVLLEVADLVHRVAGWQCRWAGRVLGVTLTEPEQPAVEGSVRARCAASVRDRGTWRRLGWLCWQSLAEPVGALAVFVPAYLAVQLVRGADDAVSYLILGVPAAALVLLAGLIAMIVSEAHAVLSRWWLAVPEERTSASARISELTRSRASTVDAQAAELRRIERDLHDGVQARLVSLGLTVGLARQQVGALSPDADALLADVQRSVGDTLDELRALVRGIHPPVLAERGLPAALSSLALSASVPVGTRVEQAGAFEAPVESAVYFAAAEALTNISRHADASAAELELGYEAGRLRLVITDNGAGGADETGGTGLRGIRGRVAAFDGIMIVPSPPGGPTEIRVEVPCEPSSPRTRPCSGTASPASSPRTASP